MHTYRVIFSNDVPLFAKKVNETTVFDGKHFLEHDNGRMIVAIIKAESEEHATRIASDLAKNTKEKLQTP